jgi:phosphate acyltransferase
VDFNFLLDVGTNPDAKPDVLYQFAILGSLYGEYVHNIKNPRVGLLNIGEEEKKGNLLAQATYQLMKIPMTSILSETLKGATFSKTKPM